MVSNLFGDGWIEALRFEPNPHISLQKEILL